MFGNFGHGHGGGGGGHWGGGGHHGGHWGGRTIYVNGGYGPWWGYPYDYVPEYTTTDDSGNAVLKIIAAIKANPSLSDADKAKIIGNIATTLRKVQ